jgi:YihY family inner membrane protein
VKAVFPGPAAQQNAIALAIDQLSKQAPLLTVIAVVTAIFGGSRLFVTMESCLNIIYHVRTRTFIPQNLMAMGMLILFIILVPLMVFSAAIPQFVLGFMVKNPLLANISFVKAVVSSPVITYAATLFGGLVAAFLLFEAIYLIVPYLRITWRGSWVGALAAAVAMVIFLNLFPLYIRYFMRSYAGAIGFAVILMLFFYYFAVILMLGAEVNAFFRDHVQPMPNDLATFVSTMAGKLNQDIPPGEAHPHRSPEPTEQADRAHIARARRSEEETREKNMQKQRQLVAGEAKRQDRGKARQSSRLTTLLLSVMIGSIVTVIAELRRSRQKAR